MTSKIDFAVIDDFIQALDNYIQESLNQEKLPALNDGQELALEAENGDIKKWIVVKGSGEVKVSFNGETDQDLSAVLNKGIFKVFFENIDQIAAAIKPDYTQTGKDTDEPDGNGILKNITDFISGKNKCKEHLKKALQEFTIAQNNIDEARHNLGDLSDCIDKTQQQLNGIKARLKQESVRSQQIREKYRLDNDVKSGK